MKQEAYCTDTFQFVLPALDTALVFAVFYLIDYSPAGLALRHAGLAGYPSLLFVFFVISWGLLARQYANVHCLGRLISYGEKLGCVLRTLLLHAGLVALGMLLLGNELAPLRFLVPYLATIYLALLVAIPAGRFALAFGVRAYQRYLAPRRRHVIVGLSQSGQELNRMLSGYEAHGSKFMGFFVEGSEQVPEHLRPLVRGTIVGLKAFCHHNRVDALYLALPPGRQALIHDLSEYAAKYSLGLRTVSDLPGTVRRNGSARPHTQLPALIIQRVPLSLYTNQLAKRAFDIAFSGLVIVLVLSWALPLLVLLIKLDSRGPVFYKQLRSGWRNQLFPCYKLRTTHHGSGSAGLQTAKADLHLTRVGGYLRRHKLDELPQFFNVLLGHMSVLGTRANTVPQPEEHSQKARTYSLRHAVLPSLTSYAK